MRAVALSAAVEEDDVAGEAAGVLGAVEDGADGGEGLVVGEVAGAAHDALLEEPGAGAGLLHVRVVVAFEGEDVHVLEGFDEVRGDAAEVGGVADAAAGGFDEEAVGAGAVVGEGDGGGGDGGEEVEGLGVERGDEGGELVGMVAAAAGGEGGVPLAGDVEEVGDAAVVAEELDAAVEDGGEPVGAEVVAVEVGEADGGDIRDGDAGALQALCGGAGADAGVDEGEGVG